MTQQDARERALYAHKFVEWNGDSGFRDANNVMIPVCVFDGQLEAAHRPPERLEDEPRIAALVAALDEERAKFQNETLRTSELTQLLLRFAHLHTDRGHEPGAWSRTCIDCELVVEARALISKPINVRALAGQMEAERGGAR